MSVIVFSVLLWFSGCSRGSSADIQNIPAGPGENVTLMCKDPENKTITLLEWRKKDSEILFVIRDGRPFPSTQHESYRNRVILKDRQMKDGDLSVVLKNVTINDSGTYECKARHETGDPLNLNTVHLSVVPPDVPSPDVPSPGDQDGDSHGLWGLIVLPVLAGVLGLLLWFYKKKPVGFSKASSDKQTDDL